LSAFVILISANLAAASPKTDAIAQELYATTEDRAFVSKFFEIVESHKTSDPLLRKHGPSIKDYHLDSVKFAFMVTDTKKTTDLVIFNWNLAVFSGLEPHPKLSELYGTPVYILKNVEKTSIASQGEANSEITNFSYLFGSNHSYAGIKAQEPNAEVPD